MINHEVSVPQTLKGYYFLIGELFHHQVTTQLDLWLVGDPQIFGSSPPR